MAYAFLYFGWFVSSKEEEKSVFRLGFTFHSQTGLIDLAFCFLSRWYTSEKELYF